MAVKDNGSNVSSIRYGPSFVGQTFVEKVKKQNGKIYLVTIENIVEQKLMDKGDFISTSIFRKDDGGKEV